MAPTVLAQHRGALRSARLLLAVYAELAFGQRLRVMPGAADQAAAAARADAAWASPKAALRDAALLTGASAPGAVGRDLRCKPLTDAHGELLDQNGHLLLSKQGCRTGCSVGDETCVCRMVCRQEAADVRHQGDKVCRVDDAFGVPVWAERDPSAPGTPTSDRSESDQSDVGGGASDAASGPRDEIPLCMPPLRVKAVDAVSAKPIAGALVRLLPGRDSPINAAAMERHTDEGGHADFPTPLVHMRMELASKGYIQAVREFKRSAVCQETEEDSAPSEACMVQVAATPRLEGDFDQACAFAVKDGQGSFAMRAVLEWATSDGDRSPVGLDLWARSAGCFEDVRNRYKCPYANDFETYFTEDECGRKNFTQEEVRSREARACSVLAKALAGGPRVQRPHANQFPKWVEAPSGARSVRNLQFRLDDRGERVPAPDADQWMSENYIRLDTSTEGRFGPETVTFRNTPPGIYQLVVNKPSIVNPDGHRDSSPVSDVNQDDPVVNIYLGNSARVTCRIDPMCARKSRVWNVANVRVDPAGEEYDALGIKTGRSLYRVEVVDTKQNMQALHSLDLPTTEEEETSARSVPKGVPIQEEYFQSVSGYTDQYLSNVCYGTCTASATSEQAPSGCMARCTGASSCRAPVGVPNAAPTACLEGDCIALQTTCTTRCADAYAPTVPELLCNLGAFQPSAFQCEPAPCEVEGSNRQPGKHCRCLDAFEGSITWDGGEVTADTKCEPATCLVENSNRLPGAKCACLDGYVGSISWRGATPFGSCHALPCDAEHSNGLPGAACACADGFQGRLEWRGQTLYGHCAPVPCEVEGSNRRPGPECACSPGYVGEVKWEGAEVAGGSKCESAKELLDAALASARALEARRTPLEERRAWLALDSAVKGDDHRSIEQCCCKDDAPTADNDGERTGLAPQVVPPRCVMLRAYRTNVRGQMPHDEHLREVNEWFGKDKWECPKDMYKATTAGEEAMCLEAERDRMVQLCDVHDQLNMIDPSLDDLRVKIATYREHL